MDNRLNEIDDGKKAKFSFGSILLKGAKSMIPPYVTLTSIIVNILQGVLNILQHFSNRRLRKYQDFEYAPHLQLKDEEIGVLHETIGHSISYSAKIENSGSKAVHIKGIFLDCGSEDNSQKRYKFGMEGEFYLRPGESKEITKSFLSSEIRETKEKFGLEDCYFSLRVIYYKAPGKSTEKEIFLVHTGTKGVIFTARRGSVIA